MMYPELEKMASAKQASHIIGEFMEWIGEQGYVIAQLDEPSVLDPNPQQLIPVYKSINDLLAQYFDIDLNKVQQESVRFLTISATKE